MPVDLDARSMSLPRTPEATTRPCERPGRFDAGRFDAGRFDAGRFDAGRFDMGGLARAAGVATFAATLVLLLTAPRAGLHLVWNVVVPLVPAILFLAPGAWRNACPLGTMSRAAARRGERRRGRGSNETTAAAAVSRRTQEAAAVAGIALFFVIVPLRHPLFDLDATATAIALVGIAALAILAGSRLPGRAGWCNGACPVLPVERLYGSRPAIVPTDRQCATCIRCVAICGDSMSNVSPATGKRRSPRRIAGLVFVGALPGFIAGWFRVPDTRILDLGLADAARAIATAYGLPLIGGAISLALFLFVAPRIGLSRESTRVRSFAAAAGIAYYAHRLPALFGGGVRPGDGALVDLTGIAPPAFFIALAVLPVVLFSAWLIGSARDSERRPWSVRVAPETRGTSPRPPARATHRPGQSQRAAVIRPTTTTANAGG